MSELRNVEILALPHQHGGQGLAFAPDKIDKLVMYGFELISA
jgi:hypothetical protein